MFYIDQSVMVCKNNFTQMEAGMRKVEREYISLCRAEGADLVWLERRGNHIALHFERGFVIAASTPSDRRNRANVRAQIRRFNA